MTHYTTTAANINSMGYRADQHPRTATPAEQAAHLRRCIEARESAGQDVKWLKTQLAGIEGGK